MSFLADKYYRFDELSAVLEFFRSTYPDCFSFESIGKSGEGRDIWVATITSAGSDPDAKPAYWIDANTHASEVAGSSAALYTMNHLLVNREKGEIAELLSKFTFYICPRLNPDGAEFCLDENHTLRSVRRNYPDKDAIPTFQACDFNGNGIVLQMRWEDENGAWCISEDDNRLMVPRMPWSKGPFFQLSKEGIFREDVLKDIPLPVENTAPFGLDFNRNYPHQWRPEHQQLGAGIYPLSEPETRAVVDFLYAHRNIGGMVTHHTYSGVILRPFTDKNDHDMPKFDLSVFKLIGKRGEEVTGYPCLSVFHDFAYDPKKAEGGVFDDWAYEQYGVHCYTMELWDPQKRAGIDLSKGYLDFWFKCTDEQELKMLTWNDEELDGKGFVNWESFDHPQLAKVEIGGWDWMYSTRNPPPKFLEETSKKACDFALAHAACLPQLSMEIESTIIEGTTRTLRVVLQNKGFLPTYICDIAKTRVLVKQSTLVLELSEGLELIEGKREQRVDHLDGIFNRNQPRFPAMFISGDTDHSKKAISFVLKGEGTLRAKWYGDRIGEIVREYTI